MELPVEMLERIVAANANNQSKQAKQSKEKAVEVEVGGPPAEGGEEEGV